MHLFLFYSNFTGNPYFFLLFARALLQLCLSGLVIATLWPFSLSWPFWLGQYGQFRSLCKEQENVDGLQRQNCQNPTQLNSTQSNSKATSVGVRHSSHVFPTPPPTTTTNFSATSRPARELKFGTDTH